ncbi:MAG: hypothetical protein KY410_05790 [Proteobacteria bacterium]|nr:hypothetical protein [Pseudomonadota bacterium]
MTTELAPRIAQFPVAIRFAASVLRPVVRTLLRLGISANEVNDLVRWLYVDEFYQRKEFWHRRKPFGARAALLSGLSRKEVNRLSQIDTPDAAILTDQQNRATRVLAGWVASTFTSKRVPPATIRKLRCLPTPASPGLA